VAKSRNVVVRAGKPSAIIDTRVIYCGDNLEQLSKLPDKCVDLIYIDPPFNSNRNYEVFWGDTREKRSFEDRHASTEAYIEFMRPRCVELHRVLKDAGSFYYHCDWHASHYVKVMLDTIFGENQFQNEIVWKRTTAHNDQGRYGNVHDTLFFYAKGKKWTWNTQYQAYSEKLLARFKRIDPDGRRWYDDNITGAGETKNDYEWKGMRPPNGRHWAYDKVTMEKMDQEGRIFYTSTGTPRLKRYFDEAKGVPLQSVWTDIAALNSQATERLGFPTQKPISLLSRIIKSSSNPNDIVLDAFCGCGTALEACEHLGRQWIGIDVSPTACQVMAKRLRDTCGLKENEAMRKIGRGYALRDLPWSEDKLRKIPPFEFENWAVIRLNGQPNRAQVGDMGIDGRIYPVSALPKLAGEKAGELDFMDNWYPIQVKQKDKTGRPDIDSFEAVMMREDRNKGFFVSFDFTTDALQECRAFQKRTGKVIKPLRVTDMLDDHQLAYQLA
jgi:DNA modification methylase